MKGNMYIRRCYEANTTDLGHAGVLPDVGDYPHRGRKMAIVIYIFIGLMALFGIGWLILAIATVLIQLLCDLIRLMVVSIGYVVIDCYDLINARRTRRFAAAVPTVHEREMPLIGRGGE
jgi:hypothetical protein